MKFPLSNCNRANPSPSGTKPFPAGKRLAQRVEPAFSPVGLPATRRRVPPDHSSAAAAVVRPAAADSPLAKGCPVSESRVSAGSPPGPGPAAHAAILCRPLGTRACADGPGRRCGRPGRGPRAGAAWTPRVRAAAEIPCWRGMTGAGMGRARLAVAGRRGSRPCADPFLTTGARTAFRASASEAWTRLAARE